MSSPGKDVIHQTPDDLFHGLAYDLGEFRATFRAMALRKKQQWEPSQQDCDEIARRLIDGMKRRGVVQIVREISKAHSMRPCPVVIAAPAAAMIWWGMPRSEA